MAVSFDQAIDTIHAMFSDMDRDTIAMILEDQQGTESPRFGSRASSLCSFRFLYTFGRQRRCHAAGHMEKTVELLLSMQDTSPPPPVSTCPSVDDSLVNVPLAASIPPHLLPLPSLPTIDVMLLTHSLSGVGRSRKRRRRRRRRRRRSRPRAFGPIPRRYRCGCRSCKDAAGRTVSGRAPRRRRLRAVR